MADGSGSIGQAGTRGRRGRTAVGSLRLPLLLLAPVLALVAGGYVYLTGGRYIATDNAYVRADIVQVSTDVSGMVKTVEVADNQKVDAGQVLFRLDDAPYRFALDNAQAQLAVARSDIEAMKANWREKQQELRLAQINIDFADRDWKRKSELFAQHVIPQAQMDQAQQALDAARQQMQTLQQQLAGLAANLGGDPNAPTDRHPRVLAAQSQLDQAQRNLDRTVVTASIAGVVTNVPSLEPGMYLRESMAAVSLVATDHVWIEANPKETQLTWVQPGQPVTISVDTYPDVEWHGSVASLSPASGSQFSLLPAQNTSGNWVKVVQRIPIRVLVKTEPNQPVLRAGMSAQIEIDTGHKRSLHSLLASFGLAGG
jgi:membrane fusion protein (multidrug efflux system)